MGNAATIDIKGNNQPLKKDLDDSEKAVKSFGDRIVGTFAAIGAAIAAKKVFNFALGLGESFLTAASEAEEAQAKLDAVLTATGHAAGFQTEQLVGLAGQLQSVTKFTDEAVMGAQAVLASFRNVRGDIFVDATRAIADLSTVMGTDLKGAALQVGKALNDPEQGMMALTRAGVTFTQSQKDMIDKLIKAGDVMGAQRVILSELQNEFGGAAEKVGSTFGGQLEIMKNRFGEIAEDLGRALIPAVEAFAPLIDAVATFVENSVPYFQKGIELIIIGGQALVAQLRPVFSYLVDGAISAFSVVQFVMEHFGDITKRVMLGFQLSIIQTYESIKYYIGSVIPDLFMWFAQNWQLLFSDVERFTSQVLANVDLNIKNFVLSISKLLSSGGGYPDFRFTALTEGFELSLRELPKIAARVIGEDEKALGKIVEGLDAKLALDLLGTFNENKARLNSLFDTVKTEELDLSNNADTKFNPDDFTTKDDKEAKTKKDKKDKADKEKQEKLGEFVALEELNKRIQAAALRTAEDRKKVAEKEGDADDEELSNLDKDNLFGAATNKKAFKKSREPDLILKSDTAKALSGLPRNDMEVIAAIEATKEPVKKQNDLLQIIADSSRSMAELLTKQNAHSEKIVEKTEELISEMPGIAGLY